MICELYFYYETVVLVRTDFVLTKRLFLPPNWLGLPTVARREGCALIVPKSDEKDHFANKNIQRVLKLLDLLGGYVECESEEQMNVMITPTCFMGTLYAILRQNQKWLVRQGVPPQNATYFIGKSYWSMMQDAENGCHDEPGRFEHLVAEQTPDGLNEQVRIAGFLVSTLP